MEAVCDEAFRYRTGCENPDRSTRAGDPDRTKFRPPTTSTQTEPAVSFNGHQAIKPLVEGADWLEGHTGGGGAGGGGEGGSGGGGGLYPPGGSGGLYACAAYMFCMGCKELISRCEQNS